MKEIDEQKGMDANESAPMPTKGKKGANFRNQTTEGTKNRFPWTTIIVVVAFAILVLVVVSVLSIGTS